MKHLETPGSARLQWADLLRGEMVIAIIIFHATGLQRFGSGSTPAGIERVNRISDPHWMPTLGFLSGHLSNVSPSEGRQAFYGGKAKTLLYPYVTWTVVHALAFRSPLTPKSVVRLATGGTYLFFLPFLFVCNALSYETQELPDIPIAVAAFVANGSLERLLPSVPHRFTRWLPHVIGMFYLGRAAARHPDAWATMLRSRAVVISSSLAAAAGSVASLRKPGAISYDAAWSWSPAAGLIASSGASQRAPDNYLTQALRFVGRNSIVFYVSHYPVAYLTVRYLDRKHVTGVRVFGATLAASVVAPTALSLGRSRSSLIKRLFSAP